MYFRVTEIKSSLSTPGVGGGGEYSLIWAAPKGMVSQPF